MKKIPIKFDSLSIDVPTGLLKTDSPVTLIYLFTREGILYYGLTGMPEKLESYEIKKEPYPICLFEEVIMHSQTDDDIIEFMQLSVSNTNYIFDDNIYQYYGKLDFKTKSYERYKLPTMEGEPAYLEDGGIITNIKYGYERND